MKKKPDADAECRLHIDRISFQLGMINCFVEMVACGVKKLALSPPVTPEDYEKIRKYSEDIVRAFGIRSFLEKSLLITDLQPEAFTRNRWSILYFRQEEVLDSYMDLKSKQKALQQSGAYDKEARADISRAFMKLLSYPEEVIQEKLNGNDAKPYLLTDTI